MAEGPLSVEQSATSLTPIVQQFTVGTTPTQVPFFICKALLIKSDATNTGTIYVGLNGVTTTTGFPLSPNGAVGFPVSSSDKIWVVATVPGQIVEAVAVQRTELTYSEGTPGAPYVVPYSTVPSNSQTSITNTPTQLPSTACRFALIKNDDNSSVTVYLGNDDTVSSTTGFPLIAGQTAALTITNTNILWAVTGSSTATIDIITFA
jgi:hypothetical protein